MSGEMMKRDAAGGMLAAYAPANLSEARDVANMLAAGGMFPAYRERDGNYNAAAMFTVMALGAGMGMGPAQALGAFHVVEGRPTLSAQGMAGVIRSRGGRIRVVDEGPRHCTVEGVMPGEEPSRATYTVQEAVAAGRCQVVDGRVRARSQKGKPTPWETATADMLYARAVSRLARRIAPDLILGIYTADEAEQIAQAAPPARESLREPEAPAAAPPEDVIDVEPEPRRAPLVARRAEMLRRGASAPPRAPSAQPEPPPPPEPSAVPEPAPLEPEDEFTVDVVTVDQVRSAWKALPATVATAALESIGVTLAELRDASDGDPVLVKVLAALEAAQ